MKTFISSNALKRAKKRAAGLVVVILVVAVIAVAGWGIWKIREWYTLNPYDPNATPKRLNEEQISGMVPLPTTNSGVRISQNTWHWWIDETNLPNIGFTSTETIDETDIAVLSSFGIDEEEGPIDPVDLEYVRTMLLVRKHGPEVLMGESGLSESPHTLTTNVVMACCTNNTVYCWYTNTLGWTYIDLGPTRDTNGLPLVRTTLPTTGIPALLSRRDDLNTNWVSVITLYVPTNGESAYFIDVRSRQSFYKVTHP